MTSTSQPTVYLICGFIGAGKTTYARKLEAETGAVRITKDEWSIRLIGDDPTIEGYDEHNHNIIGLSRDVAFALASKGIDVILDEGFWAREQRRELRAAFEQVGARVEIIYVDTPIETMRQRVARRNDERTPDSFVIAPDLLDYYHQFWQPPDADEQVIRLSEVEAQG